MTHVLPITRNTIAGSDILKIKPLRVFDPGYGATCAAKSSITWINGEKGILEYRGYPIEQLAEKSTFLEVAFLLIYGELPTIDQAKYFTQRVMSHTYIHEDLKAMIGKFRYDAHPMAMLMSVMAAMGSFHPEANPQLAGETIYEHGFDDFMNKQIHRIIGSMSTVCAYIYRHRMGRPFVDPSSTLNYSENFLYMIDNLNHKNFVPNPKIARALDILLILHADHEFNASTATVRSIASTGADIYTALSAGIGALYGRLHGAANSSVIYMLEEIGSVDKIPQFIAEVKAKKRKVYGMGHRVYKRSDPRSTIIRQLANEVFELLGKEPLVEIALELEKVASTDEYFVSRNLYPNVDLFSGLIYKAMGIPSDYMTVLFALGRTVGWVAHYIETNNDPQTKITRPFQRYEGEGTRDYIPITQPRKGAEVNLKSHQSAESRRRDAGSDVPQSQ